MPANLPTRYFEAGNTLMDLTGQIHNDFSHKLKYAGIWGKAVCDGRMDQRDCRCGNGNGLNGSPVRRAHRLLPG
jgi:ribosome-interacting GTPase 1